MVSTQYEQRIEAIKGSLLGSLQQHTEPAAAALAFLRASFPAAVLDQPDGSVSLRPLASAGDREALGHAAQAATLALVAAARAAGEPAMLYRHPGHQQPAVQELLDALLWGWEQSPALIEALLPAQCLETVTECVTVGECGPVLGYLERRWPAVHGGGGQRVGLALLRTCNLLLQRLSKSQDCALCGRVLLFLSRFFRLTDRSGVNLLGAFNVGNATPVEEVAEGALDSEGHPVDAPFHAAFWGLQRWFADPRRLLEEPARWAEVGRGVRSALARFKEVAVTVTEQAPGEDGEGGRPPSVKYLTSGRLMALQLRDATFRRHFLLQARARAGPRDVSALSAGISRAAHGALTLPDPNPAGPAGLARPNPNPKP